MSSSGPCHFSKRDHMCLGRSQSPSARGVHGYSHPFACSCSYWGLLGATSMRGRCGWKNDESLPAEEGRCTLSPPHHEEFCCALAELIYADSDGFVSVFEFVAELPDERVEEAPTDFNASRIVGALKGEEVLSFKLENERDSLVIYNRCFPPGNSNIVGHARPPSRSSSATTSCRLLMLALLLVLANIVSPTNFLAQAPCRFPARDWDCCVELHCRNILDKWEGASVSHCVAIGTVRGGIGHKGRGHS